MVAWGWMSFTRLEWFWTLMILRYRISMGWLKGKSTGNHSFSHKKWKCPVFFPLNQSIEYWMYPPHIVLQKGKVSIPEAPSCGLKPPFFVNPSVNEGKSKGNQRLPEVSCRPGCAKAGNATSRGFWSLRPFCQEMFFVGWFGDGGWLNYQLWGNIRLRCDHIYTYV